MKTGRKLSIPGTLALITLSCVDVSPEVANVQHATPPEWRLEVVARIGSADNPAQALVAVGDVRLGPGGRLYVVQAADDQIWVFGPEGNLQARIGRSGDGPGEFRSISGIGFRGDTLYVADSGLHRLSFFSRAGQFLTSAQWPSQRVEAGAVREAQAAFSTSAPQILLDDGTGLLEPVVRFTASPFQMGRTSLPRLLFHVGRESGILDTILRYEIVTLVTDVPITGGDVGSVGCPFVTTPLVELRADGQGAVLVDRALPPTLDPSEFLVVAFGPAGDTVFARSSFRSSD